MDWLLSNYPWLITLVVGIVEFILLLLFKKKPLANVFADILAALYSSIPSWINEAEKTGLYGEDKKAYVMKCALEFINDRLYDPEHYWTEDVQNLISNYIERVLSTPRKKKGENNG